EKLMGMVEAAMREAGLAFADLDRIAVVTGPGSFTGLRVGIAAARGLALVSRIPVVGIGTLAALAESAREEAGAVPVLAVIDARRDEIYAEAFAADGSPLGEPVVVPARAAAAMLGPGMQLAGSGSDLVRAAAGRDVPVIHRDASPDIAAVLRLAEVAPAPVAPPKPLYLRPPDAKPQASARVARR
ncbi:MAG: tRNA (adenosine(37)-N6)-threonylcarbamoyltransferase complex dimerization subunit type 1 TsaB, partial [Rhizobiales bacterium]|nr:tRNA (adenosine(37)-N6)-threonylcarbamoyltransferase complex dimerization subunit type 1 TsaB [Hyphomicrobiales bacterium]